MQRFSFDPDPPVGGKSLKICYDFNGSGLSSTTIEVSFSSPNSGPTSYPLTPASPCVTIVCASAARILVVDKKGVSDVAEVPII